MKIKSWLFILAPLFLSSCATHVIKFHPLDGISADKQGFMERGEFDASKEKVLDAVGDVLDHEPFFHWEYLSLDKANGWIKANAGLMREANFRVVEIEGGRSRLATSVPRRALRSVAKIWIDKKDASKVSAYDPVNPAEAEQVRADFELDESYFRSAVYRALTDHSAVPFEAVSHERDDVVGEPPTRQAPDMEKKP